MFSAATFQLVINKFSVVTSCLDREWLTHPVSEVRILGSSLAGVQPCFLHLKICLVVFCHLLKSVV